MTTLQLPNMPEVIRGVIQIRSTLLRNALSECVGTVNSWVQINIGWGFAITVSATSVSRLSGGHLNPAMSTLFFSMGALDILSFLIYIISQHIGAFCGAAATYAIYRDAINDYDGGFRAVKGPNGTAQIFSTYPQSYMTHFGSYLDQTAGTGLLAFCVLSIIDPRNKIPPAAHPLLFGISLLVIGCGFGLNCGYPLNPARDFGPRIFTYFIYGNEVFTHPWSYWFLVPIIAPIIGALIGGWFYILLLGSHIPDELEKLSQQKESHNHDNDNSFVEYQFQRCCSVLRKEMDDYKRKIEGTKNMDEQHQKENTLKELETLTNQLSSLMTPGKITTANDSTKMFASEFLKNEEIEEAEEKNNVQEEYTVEASSNDSSSDLTHTSDHSTDEEQCKTQDINLREDGWWLAENQNGKRGYVPKTFLKIYKESIESKEIRKQFDKPSPMPRQTAESSTQSITVPDIFESSNSCTNHLTYECYLAPRLSKSNYAFHDIYWNYEDDRLRKRRVRVSKMIKIIRLDKIQLNSIDVHCRLVRAYLFDRKTTDEEYQIVSNVYTIKAQQRIREPREGEMSEQSLGCVMIPIINESGHCCMQNKNYTVKMFSRNSSNIKALNAEPFLATFPAIADQPDIMEMLLQLWKLSEVEEAMQFRSFFLTTGFILHQTVAMPKFSWTNARCFADRQAILNHFREQYLHNFDAIKYLSRQRCHPINIYNYAVDIIGPHAVI
ncbi:Aqp3 protein [Dirofilaria immitis]|nr:Aqp3 protein [Dirofilaria immitis]